MLPGPLRLIIRTVRTAWLLVVCMYNRVKYTCLAAVIPIRLLRWASRANVNIFENGTWQTTQSSMADLTDIDFFDDKAYLSSFGYGVEEQGSGIIVYTKATKYAG